MQIIQETVAGFQIGEPVVHRQMAMFPLLGKRADGKARAYLTLDEALASASAEVDDVMAAPASEFQAVGQGRDVRIESAAVAGGALVADGAVLHLAAFRRDAQRGPAESGGYRRASQRRANRLRRE